MIEVPEKSHGFACRVRTVKFLLLYLVILLAAMLADGQSTVNAIESGVGREVNPFIDNPESLLYMLLSPVQISLALVSVTVVFIGLRVSEKNRRWIQGSFWMIGLAAFPFTYVAVKFFAAINNWALITCGLSLMDPFHQVLGNTTLALYALVIAFAILVHPLMEMLARRFYCGQQ